MNFNKLKNINIVQKITTNTVILLIVFGVILYFGIFVTLSTIKNLRAEIITEKIETEKRVNREQNMSGLMSKLKKIEKDLEKIDNVFIDKNSELEFITTLESVANYNNVTQGINLLPIDETIKENPKSIVNIVAKGKYIDIINYMQDIESLNYYVNISMINISRVAKAQAEENNDEVSLNLNADVYWK